MAQQVGLILFLIADDYPQWATIAALLAGMLDLNDFPDTFIPLIDY